MLAENRKYLDDLLEASEMVLVGFGIELADENRNEEILATYQVIAKKLAKKNYFVVTTNTDDLIYKSDFRDDRIVAPCGSIHRFQCSRACSNELYDTKLSQCPKCGAELCENTVKSEKYIEDGYKPQWEKYMKWLTGTLNHKLCVLEVGVLFDYPTVIRWAFERTTFINQKATLVRINHKIPQLSEELKDKGKSINCHPIDFFTES